MKQQSHHFLHKKRERKIKKIKKKKKQKSLLGFPTSQWDMIESVPIREKKTFKFIEKYLTNTNIWDHLHWIRDIKHTSDCFCY